MATLIRYYFQNDECLVNLNDTDGTVELFGARLLIHWITGWI